MHKDKLPSFREVSQHIPVAFGEDEIIELARLVNPLNNKKRYDTQHFIVNLPQENILNVAQGIFDPSKINKYNELHYDDNYENMIWASPAKLINMYVNKEINLTSTQYMIINILTTFKNFKDIVSYLKTVQYNCSNSFSENIIEKRCLTMPFNLAMVKTP